MRSGIEPGNVHALEQLYEQLEPAHRTEAEDRFARCEPNARLASVGEGTPSVDALLRVYDQSYGGASRVYMDTRYYAEADDQVRVVDRSAWNEPHQEPHAVSDLPPRTWPRV